MLIVFIVLAGLWIMCGTIFVVREVEVIDVNASVAGLAVPETEMAKISQQVSLKGKNILFSIKHDQIVAQIKAVNKTIKVQGVTAHFPNKVTISISQRMPLYKYNGLFFDADMYLVGETSPAGYVDISDTGIKFDSPTLGDAARGMSTRDDYKIAELKTLAGYFNVLGEPMTGWRVSFDDSDPVVGAQRFYMQIDLNSETQFILKTAPGEDFARILAYTWAAYNEAGDKKNGTYEAHIALSGEHVGKVVVKIKNGNGEYVKHEQ